MTINELSKFYNETSKVNSYWGHQMPMMAMEEAGEFIQAISKLERYRSIGGFRPDDVTDELLVADIIKESADLLISISALGSRYGFSMGDVERAAFKKLEKKYSTE